MVSVRIDGVEGLLQRLGARAAAMGRFWPRFARTAQLLVEREQRRHFQASMSPQGVPWQPLSPVTIALSRYEALQKVGPGGRLRRSRRGRETAIGRGLGAQRTAVVRRGEGSKPLIDTGRLMASVTTGGEGAVRQITSDSLAVGTRLHYAAIHQTGGLKVLTEQERQRIEAATGRPFRKLFVAIPARPFLGLSPSAKREIAQLAARRIAEAMSGR